MKKLRINCIRGLYEEMYQPSANNFNKEIKIENSYLNLNQFFWNNILSEQSIKHMMNIAKLNISCEIQPPQIVSAVSDESIFIKNVYEARIGICDHNITPREFFRHLETLEILCSLYSRFIYNNLPFTINEAFIINESSSKQLYYDCMNQSKNPLFDWLSRDVIPAIKNYNPDIILFDGKPNLFSFCIAKFLKYSKLKIHLSITNNASEYYSLNKITKYLLKNEHLFKLFDSVILDNFHDVESALIDALSKKNSFSAINDLIFWDGSNICFNGLSKQHKNSLSITSREYSNKIEYKIAPHELVDVHIMPSCKCYWNKCAFCGINKKYSFSNFDNDNVFFNNLLLLKEYILTNNIKYIWFIDEAIPVFRLRQMAEFFLKEKISIVWQARCRIEYDLIKENLPKILYESGLRELRLGLESASMKVLKMMDKFSPDFNIGIVECIIQEYYNAGISIHFPIIIGFPGETKADRAITFEYLSDITDKYDNITFNINILYLDVSSKLFANWDSYGIKKIELPCYPEEFLGNAAYFDSIDNSILQNEQDSFMRRLLYPWYPEHAFLKPHIYYRLSETIRNTLVWKNKGINFETDNALIVSSKLKLSNNLTYFQKSSDEYIVYNWNTHRYLCANTNFVKFLELWKEGKNIYDLIKMAEKNFIPQFTFEEYFKTMKKLIKFGFFIQCELPILNTNNKYIEIEEYYDQMYNSREYDYDITINNWLLNNIEIIPKGYVLDVGIGMGSNVEYLIANGFKIHGIDLSKAVINVLKNKYNSSKCQFFCCNIIDYRLSYDYYSLIICSMSLHYLSTDDFFETITKLKKALKKNGILYIKVLSTEDALYDNKTNALVRHFFTKEELLVILNDMELVDITQIITLDNTRNLPKPYWGIIECVVKKL